MAEKTVHVRMAEMAFAGAGESLKTTLGSCVGLILHDPRRRRAALAHIMLPSRLKNDQAIAKYADTALPALLDEFAQRGSQIEHLEAYVTGGAHMFGGSEDVVVSGVGQQNLKAVREALERLAIPVVFEETGGSAGRTVVFDCDTAAIDVKTLKRPAVQRSER